MWRRLFSHIKAFFLRSKIRAISAAPTGPSHWTMWKCDLCGKTGGGNLSSGFADEEVEHCLTGCIGSLRQLSVEPVSKIESPTKSIVEELLGTDDAVATKARKAAMARDLLTRRIQAGSLLRSVSPRLGHDAEAPTTAQLIAFDAARRPISLSDKPKHVVGFGSTSIPGLSSANIIIQPQIIFKIEYLVIPSYVAKDFFVTDLKVGGQSQFSSIGAIPALVFAENAFPAILLKTDVCQIAQYITLSVTNKCKNARNFQGAVIGISAERELESDMRVLRRLVSPTSSQYNPYGNDD